jgi:hypothetical protein
MFSTRPACGETAAKRRKPPSSLFCVANSSTAERERAEDLAAALAQANGRGAWFHA